MYPVSYTYDAYGRLSTMKTYREGQGWSGETFPTGMASDATTWTYHEATGLLTSKTDAANKAVSYTYGTAGRLATRTWARTEEGSPLITAYNYDPRSGELIGIDYSEDTPDAAFTFDRLGRQKTVQDGTGTRTFFYNANLQLAGEVITGLDNATITRSYDELGRAGSFSLDSDYYITYGYDQATGRFQNVGWTAASKSGTMSYSYLENSDLLAALTSDLGPLTSYSYDPNRNLRTQIRNEFSGNLISQYDYNYDSLGRRTNVSNSGTAFSSAKFNEFGYNDRSELTSSNRYAGNLGDTSQPVNAEARAYAYDPIGNRTTATESVKQLTYTANQLNQYQLIASSVGSAAPAYDSDGNLVSAPAETVGTAETAGTVLYNYDAENRLISVEPQAPAVGSTKVEYVYDYQSRRVVKKVFAYAAGAWSLQSTSIFIYDGWNLICENKTPAGGTPTPVFYVWGLDLSGTLQGAGGIGGLLARMKDGAAQQYTFDGNCNVAQLISSTGAIVAQYEYDPYGNAIVATGDNPFRFSTKFFDDETGLLYYGYRYYSPMLGRWLNRDPIGEEGGFNLYGFVQNNPTNKYDLLGLWRPEDHWLLTSQSFRTSSIPGEMRTGENSASYWRILIQANLAVDKNHSGDLDWHFNRKIGASVDLAKIQYKYRLSRLLRSDDGFYGLLKKPSKPNCERSLIIAGELSHAWQDYYGHAIKMNFTTIQLPLMGTPMGILPHAIEWFGGAEPGFLEGDPNNIWGNIKPSSWNGVWNTGEHGATEPGDRAPDQYRRKEEARAFVANQFTEHLTKWWEVCACYKDDIGR